jgi:hypothetical protein
MTKKVLADLAVGSKPTLSEPHSTSSIYQYTPHIQVMLGCADQASSPSAQWR